MDLSTLISEKDFKYHQLTQRLNEFEDEAHRQRRLNDTLTNKILQLREEISANADEYEKELTKLEQEKQKEITKLEVEKQEAQDNYVKDVVEMKKEITTLKDRINVKEELIIPVIFLKGWFKPIL